MEQNQAFNVKYIYPDEGTKLVLLIFFELIKLLKITILIR